MPSPADRRFAASPPDAKRTTGRCRYLQPNLKPSEQANEQGNLRANAQADTQSNVQNQQLPPASRPSDGPPHVQNVPPNVPPNVQQNVHQNVHQNVPPNSAHADAHRAAAPQATQAHPAGHDQAAALEKLNTARTVTPPQLTPQSNEIPSRGENGDLNNTSTPAAAGEASVSTDEAVPPGQAPPTQTQTPATDRPHLDGDNEPSTPAATAACHPSVLNTPLARGELQGVAATDLQAAAAQLADKIVATDRRVVICQLDDPPAHTQLLECLTQELAQAALLLWPDWYGPDVTLSEESATTRVTTDNNLSALLAANVRVDAAWFRRASLLANRNQPPCVPDTSVTRQVRELASCLRSEDVCLIVTIALPQFESDRLHGILQALEWLAREADAPVIAVSCEHAIPSDCRIVFQPWHDAPVEHPPEPEEFRQRLLPFVGRPHPYSPGERQLAAALAADPKLSALFDFNQPVTVCTGRCFIVDLLWPEGKVVVEVDGYSNHSRPNMFNSDRQRDYELLISDYAVLRVPHTDAVNDTDAVVQKIRQVVHWRTGEAKHD